MWKIIFKFSLIFVINEERRKWMFQIITIALTVLVAWITLYDREERSIYLSKKAVWILVPFIAFLLSFCIVKVPSNNVGIRWSILSGTSEKTLNEGIAFKTPLDQIYCIPTTVEERTIKRSISKQRMPSLWQHKSMWNFA